MRKDTIGNKKGPGKLIAKNNLPEKVCVVCHRPFTWRKKWERVWDEVTTCSKSCNAKRKTMTKQSASAAAAAIDDDLPPGDTTPTICTTTEDLVSSSCSDGEEHDTRIEDDAKATKKLLRKQQKEAVKAQKQERRMKRMGNGPPELGRKPCDLCNKYVDLLIRCTIDETRTYFMICGQCWPTVSGGVPDGDSSKFPYYQYGGLWKNRNANLKKRIGSGPSKKKTTSTPVEVSSFLERDDD